MKYYSLNDRRFTADFRKATLEGQSPDGGLYFPETIPAWPKALIEAFSKMSQAEIGFEIMRPYVGNCMSDAVLLEIMKETLNFEFPIKRLNEETWSLELFHGPTLAFKDLGARFLSRCMGHFARNLNERMVVLVATSGDTGGAVADAFHHIEGTEVVILYPSRKVSPVQEKQLTGLGGNICALEVEGDFDDCQHIVKQAFQDKDLKNGILLTSSNSINISRWLSQQIYYVLAYTQWEQSTPPIFSVPSGNFGNLCAGLVAQRSGLPVAKFIAACNANHTFTNYIHKGEFLASSSIPTISNAMDVGQPSNFIRIKALFNDSHDEIKNVIDSYWLSDEETRYWMRDMYAKYNYTLDPHSAVAYGAMKKWQQAHGNTQGIIVSTAHPIKFPEVVEQSIGEPLGITPQIMELLNREKKSIRIKSNYSSFKDAFMNVIHNK